MKKILVVLFAVLIFVSLGCAEPLNLDSAIKSLAKKAFDSGVGFGVLAAHDPRFQKCKTDEDVLNLAYEIAREGSKKAGNKGRLPWEEK